MKDDDVGHLCTTAPCGLCIWITSVALLLPTSYFYADSGVAKFFWWIFWLFGILTGLFLFIWFTTAAFGAAKCNSRLGSYLFGGLVCHLWCWWPFALAGWWFLASHSKMLHGEVALNVEPQEIAELYKGEEAPVAYRLKSGMAMQLQAEGVYQDVPICNMSVFYYDCHHYKKSKICTNEQCGTRCDVNGNCHSHCEWDDYDCSYWTFAHKCPGYNYISMVPVWAAVDKSRPAGQTPSALVYQVETFLFDYGQETQMQTHYQEKCEAPFPAQTCEGSKVCALDLRSDEVVKYWSKHDNWKPQFMDSTVAHTIGNGNTSVTIVGIGRKHSLYTKELSGKEASSMVRQFVAAKGQSNGFSLVDLPLLWTPKGVVQSFADLEKSLGEAEEDGEKAKNLLYPTMIVPGVCMILVIWMTCTCLDGHTDWRWTCWCHCGAYHPKPKPKVHPVIHRPEPVVHEPQVSALEELHEELEHPKPKPIEPTTEPGTNEPGTNEPGTKEPGTKEPAKLEVEEVDSPPVKEATAQEFLRAMRAKYVLGREKAAADILDYLPDEDSQALRPFEEEVRGGGEQKIAELAKRWNITLPPPEATNFTNAPNITNQPPDLSNITPTN